MNRLFLLLENNAKIISIRIIFIYIKEDTK